MLSRVKIDSHLQQNKIQIKADMIETYGVKFGGGFRHVRSNRDPHKNGAPT